MLYKVLLLTGIIFIFDFAIGKTLEHFYFTQASGPFYRTTYSMDSTRADILIFGSSRANHHYDPRVFENSLRMSCYNNGRDGNFLLYNYAVFKTVIERYTPQIVIFDVDRNELSSTADDYERLSSLLPYKNRNSAVDQTIALRSPYEKVKCLSNIYPYNSLLLTIAIGNTEMNKERKPDIKGYVPISGTWNITSAGIDSNPIRQIANANKVEYLDYSSDTTYLNNHNYFSDPAHLNENGARLFSGTLAAYLQKSEE